MLLKYSMSVSTDPEKPNYIGLINEAVCTSDEKDIGDIYAINKFFLVVKEGFFNTHFYYIPLEKVDGWDGYALWIKISKDEISKYERDVFPDSTRYYVKGVHYESFPPYVPQPERIPRRYRGPNFDSNIGKNESEVKYLCDLCNQKFDKEEGLSDHIIDNHK